MKSWKIQGIFCENGAWVKECGFIDVQKLKNIWVGKT
jgi:hypothetical protein